MKYMAVWSIHENNFKATIEQWATKNPQPSASPTRLTVTCRQP